MTDKSFERQFIKKVEIKRILERITKRELCTVFDVNYQFYVNTVSGRNVASRKMIDKLEEYLKTSQDDVYKMVFNSRAEEEGHHPFLEITEDDIEKYKHEHESL